MAILTVAIAAFNAADCGTASTEAPGPASVPGIDVKLGQKLFEDRCASCHEHPAGRIPATSAIANNTPSIIMGALRGGVMSAQATGLTGLQIADIAFALSKNRQGGILTDEGNFLPKCTTAPSELSLNAPQWNGWGRDLRNSRYQPDPGLSANDVPRLKVKWALAYAGDRAGQPTIIGDRLFANDTAGVIYALDAKTGCAYWRFASGAGTRTTIVVGALGSDGAAKRLAVYFADQGRDVYALDAQTGSLIWKTHVDDQPAALMTGSPVLYDGRLFVPISSGEEYFATLPHYQCCRFRGAIAALDAASGRLLWKTYTTQQTPQIFKRNRAGEPMYGPAGGAIWSAPTVDAKRGLLYVGTGNSYTEMKHEGSDAVIALSISTGAIRWINQLTAKDNYIEGCFPGQAHGPNCPEELGGDYDIGASPILHTLADGKDVLLIGQKSSQVWALDPDANGNVIWSRRLSTGGPLGGVEFGPATDRDTIYVAISDIYMRALARPGLTALRIADGMTLWHTAPPHLACRWTNEYCTPAQSQAVTAVPGVVFSGSMDGHLRAYAAADGSILWDVDTAAKPYQTLSGEMAQGGILDAAGPTVVNGMLYVNSGYAGRSGGNSVLLAFSVDGK